MTSDAQLLPLSRGYSSRDRIPTIDRVDPRIFSERYFADCMSCTFCNDVCCQYGCGVDSRIHQRLIDHADALERFVGVSRGEWFTEEWSYDAEEAPDGRKTRTQVRDGLCVFVHREGRGCQIHRFCLENGIDYHDLKPRSCWLFPIVYIEGALMPAYEIRVERELVCIDQGPPLYDAARDELRYYFGDELVAELDEMAPAFRPPQPLVPLRVPGREG